MAIHTVADIVIPEVVLNDTVQGVAFKEIPLLRSGAVTPIGGPGGDPWQDGGSTVTLFVQKFGSGVASAGAFAKDMVRDSKTGADGEKILIESYTEAVVNKTIPIEADRFMFTDAARVSDVGGWVGRTIAQGQAECIQDTLIAKANASGALRVSRLAESTKTLTVDTFAKAKMAWGDKVQTIAQAGMPGMFVHSKQFEDLIMTSEYKTLATAANPVLVQAAAAMGAVAVVHGVAVFLMDSIPRPGAGLTISSITRSSAVATLTTSAAHGLVMGDYVTISGASQAEYNGTFEVATVPTATTITFAVTGTPTTPATGSPVFTTNYNSLLFGAGALGLLIKEVVADPVKLHAGSTVASFDTHFRFVTTRRRHAPLRVVKVVTQ